MTAPRTAPARKLRLGLKLWTLNHTLADSARDLYVGGLIDYVELYIVPTSFENTFRNWAAFDLPLVLHAPHFGHGFNLSLKASETRNRTMWQEVTAFHKLMPAAPIIVHLGTGGSLSESVRQLRMLAALSGQPEILIENKPGKALDGTDCVGTTPTDISEAMQACQAGFCLDIAHAVYLAGYLGIESAPLIREFMALEPAMFHICDGFQGKTRDKHLNFGDGDFDLAGLFGLLPPEARVTLETPKDSLENLTLFKKECRLVAEITETDRTSE